MVFSMKKLRTGIIGCGKVADFHAQIYTRLDNSNFVAVCDRHIEKAKSFAAKYGVKAYSNITTMITECNLDVVSICTPHPVHRVGAVEAAECGCNVLIEKPLAVSVSDCDAIIAAGEKNHVTIGTIVQRRYYNPCKRMKKAIDDGKIGKPIIGELVMLGWRSKEYYETDPWRGTWKGEGGGVLVTQAIHQLDLLQWFMGSDIDEVYGIWKNYNHPTIEVEDTAAAIVKFKSGAIATVLASNSQNPALYGKVHIFGDNGASIGVQTDGGSMFIAGVSKITEAPYNDLWTIPGEENNLGIMKNEDEKAFFRVDSMLHSHELQIDEFLQAIIEGKKPAVYAKEGKKSVVLFEAIYTCTATNQVVKVNTK